MQPVQSTSAQQDSSRTLKQRTPQEIPHPLAVSSSVQTSPASAQVDMKCQGQGTPPSAIMRPAAQNNVDTTCASLVGMPTSPRLWSSVKLPQSAASKLVRSTTALATGQIPPMFQNLHATLSPQRHAAKLLAPVTLAATVGCRTKRTQSSPDTPEGKAHDNHTAPLPTWIQRVCRVAKQDQKGVHAMLHAVAGISASGRSQQQGPTQDPSARAAHRARRRPTSASRGLVSAAS